MAFTPDVVAAVRALVPGQRTTLLVSAHHIGQADARPTDALDWAVAAGATDAGLQYTLVNEAGVTAARAAGLLLGGWTGDAERAMRPLRELRGGGVATGRPRVAQGGLRGGAW